ncbi:MAG: hypothetical protein ACJASX_000434 [Limisphaerales bacterium]|jgi:hypothetical protein
MPDKIRIGADGSKGGQAVQPHRALPRHVGLGGLVSIRSHLCGLSLRTRISFPNPPRTFKSSARYDESAVGTTADGTGT